jgi:hypothetical protein
VMKILVLIVFCMTTLYSLGDGCEHFGKLNASASVLIIREVCFFKTLVTIYQSTSCRNPQRHGMSHVGCSSDTKCIKRVEANRALDTRMAPQELILLMARSEKQPFLIFRNSELIC